MAISRREALTAFASLIASAALPAEAIIPIPGIAKSKTGAVAAKLPGGVVTAALTPLDKDLNPDYPMLLRIFRYEGKFWSASWRTKFPLRTSPACRCKRHTPGRQVGMTDVFA